MAGRRKKKSGQGEMHIHQAAYATNYDVSADGRRILSKSVLVNISENSNEPAYFEEDIYTSQALEQANFSYLCGDSGGGADGWGMDESVRGEQDGSGIDVRLAGGEPGDAPAPTVFQRWTDADQPVRVFMQRYRDETLDEMLRAEGRGDPEGYAACVQCKETEPSPLYRCARQTCLGTGMFCEGCIAKKHRDLPTHTIERWTGEFFTPMTVGDLDSAPRIQLGHPAGSFCPAAKPAHKDFVIIDIMGIRVVKLNFCGCDSNVAHRQQLLRACLWPATSIDPQTCATFNVIRLFEVQNCLGKMSAYDFVRSLELLTNGAGLTPPPDRRRAFRAIVREYRMMDMNKRAGRGHADSGTAGTGQGELAELCRLCPQPKMNLPDGYDSVNWEEMDEDQRYKYFLFLSQDANFKLINRNVSTEEKDPIVDDGAGYFCNRAEYSEHIRRHVDEEEISSCSGFQAMFLANAKRVKGLRVTGVGGVTCARHNMWRANGIGDLQVGERWCNMDFLFFASLLGFVLTYLVLSYDIACQFSKHVWERMPDLPEKYHLKVSPSNVRWMVPNFHLPPHKPGCHSPFSFHWLWGAGRTHGETVEQNWEFLNGIAASTKLMGLGARHTALEGLFAFHNWRRIIAHHRIMLQRMAEAIKDGKAHKDAFEAFHEGLSDVEGVDLSAWRSWVDRWERDAHVENEKDSPYEYEEEGLSLKEIRLKLAAEEYSVTGDNEEVEREDTPSTFISMGMELEESQRQLAVAIHAAGGTPTTSQELDFLKRRSIACAKGLDGIEARLRTGEASEALAHLRQGLRTRTMTNKFKIRNWSGQRALTRGQGILRQINIKIHASKLRYRYARQALLKLKGHGEWEKQFRVLKDDDVRALNERSLREEEQAQDEFLGALGAADGMDATGAVALGEGHRTLSWIWYSTSSAETSDQKLHDALRVEWCKAYSRSNRWHEELVLLEEEMRRMIEFGRSMESRWIERAGARTRMLNDGTKVVDRVVLEGVRAYAFEQADREARTHKMLQVKWAPLRAKAAAYLRGEDLSVTANVVVEVDADQLRWMQSRDFNAEEMENDMYS